MARLVIVSGGIMMLGLIAVFAAIVYKLGMLGDTAVPAGASAAFTDGSIEAAIAVPSGGRLIGADLDGNHALLTIETDDASTLVLVDLATGNVLGRYALTPE